MKYISNLEAYKAELHPTLYAALRSLDDGQAHGVRYDLLDRYLAMADGTVFRIEKGFRSVADQEMIYQNQDKSNPVTMLRGGESLHQWGLACDLVFRVPGWATAKVECCEREFSNPETWKYLGLDYFYKSAGLSWGGLWSSPIDPGHVELDIGHPTDKALCGTSWWSPVVVDAKGGKMSKWLVFAIVAVVGFGVWKMTRPVISGPNVRLAGGIGPRSLA